MQPIKYDWDAFLASQAAEPKPNGMQLLFCGSNFYQETFPTGIIALQIVDK